jgi:predicted aspartyl protease
MALESGRVNSHREAVVLLRFRNGAVIECVVDTGFDGALMLPRVFVPKIQIAIIGELTLEMVGGARMSADVGVTDISWLGRWRQIEGIVSEGEDALIGTELLIATTLTIDYQSSSLAISTRENIST